MRKSGVDKEELCKQNRAGCTSPQCTVVKVVHGTNLGETTPNVNYMNGGFQNDAVCSQHDCKCQTWP